MLSINNINVIVDKKEVLNNFSLDIDDGSIHVIMGPNGVGKSTLSRVIMGDNHYKITNGDIFFIGESIKDMRIKKYHSEEVFHCDICHFYTRPLGRGIFSLCSLGLMSPDFVRAIFVIVGPKSS